jgi:hypothetical protein
LEKEKQDICLHLFGVTGCDQTQEMIYDVFCLGKSDTKTDLRAKAIAKSPLSAHPRGGIFPMQQVDVTTASEISISDTELG